MQNPKNLNPPVHLYSVATTRKVAVSYPTIALWNTMIGKKVVMAITGIALIGFVLGHMLGNLKIFAGPETINAYSRFLREVGMPELEYSQLLWLVRIFLICVALHITAAVQLTRMSRAARPIGYATKRDVETTWAARTMRWGGVLLVAFIVFHLFHLTGGLVGIRSGRVQGSRGLPECGGRVRRLANFNLLDQRSNQPSATNVAPRMFCSRIKHS